MPTIRVKENEPFDVALRRFKRTIEKTGLLTELRAREFYEKPTAERKRKKAAAVKRHYKRLRSQMLPKKLYWPLSWEIRLAWLSGNELLRKVHRLGFDTLHQRPALSRWDWPRLVAGMLVS